MFGLTQQCMTAPPWTLNTLTYIKGGGGKGSDPPPPDSPLKTREFFNTSSVYLDIYQTWNINNYYDNYDNIIIL